MEGMIGQLLNLNLFAFLLVFARIGTAMSIMPGFASMQVPIPIRLTLALLVSLVITPLVMEYLPGEPTQVSVLFLLLASEITIGLFLGLIPRIILAALQTAGTVISMVASMANVFVHDPVAEQQSSLISTFLSIMALTLIFVTDLHYLMLAALVDSYTLFQPVQGPMIADMSDFIAHKVAESFALGVQMSAPLIVSGLAYSVGLGVLGRLMPQLPVFFFGMPIQIVMQIYLFMVTLSAIMMVALRSLQDSLTAMTGAFGG